MFIDLTGQTFSRLKVICFYEKVDNNIYYLCQCICKNETIVNGSNLRSKTTRSCGCLQKEMALKTHTIHGDNNTKLYLIWANMKNRCGGFSKKTKRHYKDKGIKVCKTWITYLKFQDWAKKTGYKDGLSLERKNNSRGYKPSNCCWIPKGTQMYNRSNCIFIDGKSLKSICLEKNIPYRIVISRRFLGWPESRWFEPVKTKFRSKKHKSNDEVVKTNFIGSLE